MPDTDPIHTLRLASLDDDRRKFPDSWKLIEVTSASWAG